jgi:uncharacterized protein YcfJ
MSGGVANNTIQLEDIDKLYTESNPRQYLIIAILIIIVISSIMCFILLLFVKALSSNIYIIALVVIGVICGITVITTLVSIRNDGFLAFTQFVFSSILLPNELNDENNSNIKILVNIILIYSLDYIYKKSINGQAYLIAYKKKKEISVYKDSLKQKFAELSKIYLDIIHEEVNKIKEKEQKAFERENLQKNIDKDILISDNNINKDNTHFAVSTVIKISSKIGNIFGSISNFTFATLMATLRELWRSIVNKWSRPFAGFFLLILVISLIIGGVMGSQGGGGGGGGGGGNRNLLGGGFIGGANNMNSNKKTDILSVIQRLPENILSFIDNIIFAYSRFTEFVNNSSEIINEISSEFSNTPPVVEDRIETDGLYDNIYTFDYHYLDKIKVLSTDISTSLFTEPDNKNLYVYNLIQPKSNIQISKYYNMNHSNSISSIPNTGDINEYIYELKCADNNITESTCKLKTIPESNCSINNYKEDTSDYKNIII